MKIYVKTTCKTLTFKLTEESTIKELREMLQNNRELPPATKFTLMYLGQELEDDKTLGYYLIKNEDSIYLDYYL